MQNKPNDIQAQIPSKLEDGLLPENMMDTRIFNQSRAEYPLIKERILVKMNVHIANIRDIERRTVQS